MFKHWYSAYAGLPGAKAHAPSGVAGRPRGKSPTRQHSAPIVRPPSPGKATPPAAFCSSGKQLKRQLVKQEQERRQKEQQIRLDSTTAVRPPAYCGDGPSRAVTPSQRSVTPSNSALIRRSWTFNQPKGYELHAAEPPQPVPRPDLRSYGFDYGTAMSTPTASPCDSRAGFDDRRAEARPKSAAAPQRPTTSSSSRRPVRSATVRRPNFPSVPDLSAWKSAQTAGGDVNVASPCPTPPVEQKQQQQQQTDVSRTSTPSVAESVNLEQEVAHRERMVRIKSAPPSARSPSVRPETPTPGAGRPATPSTPSTPPSRAESATPTPGEKEDSELTYDELVDKYSWKVQIPGDPLKLK